MSEVGDSSGLNFSEQPLVFTPPPKKKKCNFIGGEIIVACSSKTENNLSRAPGHCADCQCNFLY